MDARKNLNETVVVFLSLYFWQNLTNEKNDDMTVQGTYNYGNVSRWAKKLPGKDIFNLNNRFFQSI